jgi:peptidoglycan/LPS O-acetylase OafA/YrhL
MPTTPSSKYRPEIDGLRAFAVVAVIIYHFNKDLLPSGYLGVDIFFVISGYVITSSLAGRQSKNFWDFVTGFYERRIKRLVPALIVFVLITSLLISLFNPDPGVALGLGWRSLFGISNINLYRTSTDYFAQSTELNPFTHTWSLGVEEQFYLLFPFLIWFSGFGQQTAKGARNLFFWVGSLTIASLIGFIYLYQVNQPAAYFLMPPRFWEMAAGCLLFIGFQKRIWIEQSLEHVPPLLVVTAMTAVMYLPVGAAVPATIGTVVLSAILIACLKEGTAAYKFFTLEKVVFVGLISYSLYLWHWTVLSISRWTIGIHWWTAPLQVGLMMIMATGSYRLIETPMRRHSAKNILQIFAVAAFALGSTAFLLRTFSRHAANIYQGERLAASLPSFKKTISGTSISIENCKELSWRSITTCAAPPLRKNEKTILLIGDSHASQWYPAVEQLRKSKGIGIYTHIAGWNPPAQTYPPLKYLQGDFTKKKWNDVNKYQRAMEDRFFQQGKSGDVIVLGSRLGGHFKDYSSKKYFSDNWEKAIDSNDALDLYLKSVAQLASKAHGRGIKTVLLAPIPRILVPNRELCHKQWFRPLEIANTNCSLVDHYDSIVDKLKQFARGNPSIVLFVPNHRYFDATSLTLIADMWLDDNHLSTQGALALTDSLWKSINSDSK